MSLQFGVNIIVQRRAQPMSSFVLTIEQANRYVSLLGFDNQAASETCQAAWLRNTSQACGGQQEDFVGGPVRDGGEPPF